MGDGERVFIAVCLGIPFIVFSAMFAAWALGYVP
jgi:hypothetical protein